MKLAELIIEQFTKAEMEAQMAEFKAKGGISTIIKPKRTPKIKHGSKHIGGPGDKMKQSRFGRAANTQGKLLVGK